MITNPVVITYHVDFYCKSGWFYTSCCLLQIRVMSTTTFCLKDLTLGSQFVVLLLWLVSLVPYKPHTICPNRWGRGGEDTTSQTRILCYEAVKGRQSTTIPSQSGNSEAASSDNWLESNSSPYILTFTSPSSRKRDLQLVFPVAIGNSATDNDFVTHRGQIQVVIMDWNCRLNFVGLTWPHLLWCSIEQELQRSLRWFLASVFVQVAHWVSEGGKTIAKRETFLAIRSLSLYQPPDCIVHKFLHCEANKN